MLGLGTWHMAEDAARRDDELSALRLGVDLGLTLIDTAGHLPRCTTARRAVVTLSGRAVSRDA